MPRAKVSVPDEFLDPIMSEIMAAALKRPHIDRRLVGCSTARVLNRKYI